MTEYDPALGSGEWQERVRNVPLLLFETVKTIVEMSGGDGWGLIISPEYKKLAELFEKYDDHFTEKDVFGNGITFSAYPEESISFIKYMPKDLGFYEVIVEIKWPILED